MKSFSFFKTVSAALLIGLPLLVFANTQLSAEQIAEKLEKLLAEYKQQVLYLEAENKMLKQILQEQNVKIPLERWEAIKKLRGLNDKKVSVSNTVNPPALAKVSQSSLSLNFQAPTSHITNAQHLGFINQIHKDWENIKPFYKIRQPAVIGGYEFVKGSDDHVFVDILYYGNTLSGSYDAKLLYKFDTSTFKRTLVGFFEFDRTTGWYITRRGSNPFSGVERIFVADPYLVRMPIIYSLPENANNTSVQTTGSVSSAKPNDTKPNDTKPNTNTQSTNGNASEIAAIKADYDNNRYVSVIQKSDNYLAKYAPNFEVLSLRYRTYFIITQYSKALSTIDQIKAKGWMSSKVACDAYVIASYAKNTALANAYKKQAGSSCRAIN
ncbi:hypothetical protein CSB09_02555 [Candidatus Gracilibacteria bacterium]|nr:MAG: hypothetical protein CSB09_02555 [Candidatus Gracilibacteria bacterium]